MESLLAQRAIQAGALVWKNGLADWEPLSIHFQASGSSNLAVDCAPPPTAFEPARRRIGLLWVVSLVLSVAFFFAAWSNYHSIATVFDLEDPNAVIHTYLIHCISAGAFAATGVLIWIPLVLKFRNPLRQNYKLALIFIFIACLFSIVLPISAIRYTGLIHDIAVKDAADPPPRVYQAKSGYIIYSGKIGGGGYRRLLNALDTHPEVRKIEIESNGGSIPEALRMAKLISQRGVDTHVQTHCYSACVALLLSGKNRTADVSADIALHATSASVTMDPRLEKLILKSADDEMRSYLADHGVSKQLLDETHDLGPKKLNRKTSVYLLENNLLTNVTLGDRLLSLDEARWQYVELLVRDNPETITLSNLLGAVRESDPAAAGQNASALYLAFTEGNAESVKAAVASAVKPVLERSMRSTSANALKNYLQVSASQLDYLIGRRDWLSCLAYNTGHAKLSVLSKYLLYQELNAEAAVIRDASSRAWTSETVGSREDAASAYNVAADFARPFGVDLASTQQDKKAQCISTWALEKGLLSVGTERGRAAYTWLVEQNASTAQPGE